MNQLVDPYNFKNSHNSNAIDENTNFVDNDEFYIYGDFDFTITKYIIPKLITAVQNSRNMKESIIRFYINSDGGYIHILKNILSLVEIAKANGVIVETNVMAKAYSCGSILAASGSKGYRYVSPFAEHLPHLGAISSGIVINDTEAQRMQQRIKNHFDFIRTCYNRYAKIKNLEKVIHDDCYFIRGNDVIENGLADCMLFEYEGQNESKKVSNRKLRKSTSKKS